MNDLEAKKEKLFGNQVLLVTPMLPSGEIDEKPTRKHCRL